MGFNLGLRDVASLAELIAEHRGEHPGRAAISARCAVRTMPGAPRTAREIIAFTDGLVRLFANPLGAVRRLRNVGLLAFDLLPPAKAALSSLSTGAAGRIPKLARGVAARVRVPHEPRLRRRDRRCGSRRQRHGGLLLARRQSSPGRVAIVAERLAGADTAAASAAAAADWDLRVFALSRASQRLLQIVRSLADACRRSACSPMSACAYGTRAARRKGAGSLTFDCADIGEPNLGLHRRRTRTAGMLPAGGARRRAPSSSRRSVSELEVTDTDARACASTDGRELRGALLIAADGAESKTRELLGIDTAGHAYHQDALVAHVRSDKVAPEHRLAAIPVRRAAGIPAAVRRPLLDRVEHRAGRGRAFARRSMPPHSAQRCGRRAARCSASSNSPLRLRASRSNCSMRSTTYEAARRAARRCRACGAPARGAGIESGAARLRSARRGARCGRRPRLSSGEYRLLRRYERWRKSENLLAATAFDGLERLFSNANIGRSAAAHGAGSIRWENCRSSSGSSRSAPWGWRATFPIF